MNRIISISLAGKIYQMEQNAYDYLYQSIKADYRTGVESEVAAEFDKILSGTKAYIDYSDVRTVVGKLGLVSERYAAAPDRLYRTADDKMIAGICSGMGYYFNIDPLIFRIMFVLMTIMGTVGFWLYIVLWFIIPRSPKMLR